MSQEQSAYREETPTEEVGENFKVSIDGVVVMYQDEKNNSSQEKFF